MADDTTFVSYYDQTGREQIGQQINPFHEDSSTIIIPIENLTLYNKNNEDMVDLAPTETRAAKDTKQESQQQDVETEIKDAEEQKRLQKELNQQKTTQEEVNQTV